MSDRSSPSPTFPLVALRAAGVSIWLDDLSRQRLVSGSLAQLLAEQEVVGVTTNPSIFQAALSDSRDYSAQLRQLAEQGASAEEAVMAMTTDDVRAACDLFADTFAASDGRDGRVSIEVDPRLAHDTDATIAQSIELANRVDRPNVLIKIPATLAGLPAITATLASGISVNVTLIFSLSRYRAVMGAFLDGLEAAAAAGHDLRNIHSVASFFISRVDTAVDERLQRIGTTSALGLRGQAALANARLAYQAFTQMAATARWETLADLGANIQRPLWASTAVKNPDYPDTLYVTELAAPNCVNTMPESTLRAVADHGKITPDTITGSYAASQQMLDDLAKLGISYDEVTNTLETQGVRKFMDSWEKLLANVATHLNSAKGNS